MSKFSKIMKITACGAMALTTLAGCGGSGDSSDVIKIGVNYEKSGTAATYGTSHIEGIQLAIDEINEKGGIDGKKIELDIRDNKSDAADLQSAAEGLAESGNLVILGPAITSLTKQAFSIAATTKVPTISASATGDDATLDKEGKVQEYGFKTCYNDSQQGKALADFAFEKGYRKIVIYSDSSTEYAKGLSETFATAFTAQGGEIVETVNYTTNETEFTSVLTNIKGKDFDAIYIPGYYNEASQIIKQARELGMSQPIIGPDGFDSPKLKDIVGADKLNDVYFTTHFSRVEKNEDVQKFVDDYKAKYSKEPDTFAACGYDLAYFAVDAIKRAGENPTTETVKQALIDTKDFKGITGTFSMDENHTPIKSIKVVGLENGEQSSVVEIK